MKQLPIGVQEFKELRKDGFYYVDKSMLIGQMLDQNKRGVFLYTRPRRFGKSLNLSMIDAFFNLEYKGNTWFDGLKISEHPEYDCYKNAYPVVSIDMKVGDVPDLDTFVEKFNSKLFDVFDRYTYLERSSELNNEQKSLFRKLYAGEKSVVESQYALSKLCSMLEMHHKAKVVMLIDEYDEPVNDIPDQELRRKVLSFLRGMMSSLFKGNGPLQMGVMAGITQIAKENIFSGLNNLYANDILDTGFDGMFGFTEDEVVRICKDYGHPEKSDEAKEWYDGYRFGNADVYNPWSILNYVQEGFRPGPYWVNTSANGIIDGLLSQADDVTLDRLEKLGSGKGISMPVKAMVTFDDLSGKPELVYSMMAVSGYLKAVSKGSRYLLSIPNRELFSLFADMVGEHLFRDGELYGNLREFCDAVLSDDVPRMERSLYDLTAGTLGSRASDDGHFHQAFVVGLLMALSGKYEVTAESEPDMGYYDMMLERRDGRGCNVVMGLKRSKEKEDLGKDAEEAMVRIKDGDCMHDLEGRTILYGISFHKKVPHIISETV